MNFVYDDTIKRFITGGTPATPNAHGHLQTLSQDGIEDPTYIGFTLRFDFTSAAQKQDYNRLCPGLLLEPEDLNSAQNYLRRNNQLERADYLEEFRFRLKKISEQTPWFFQSVNGVNEVIKRQEDGKPWRGFDKTITVECLESMDMRMSFIADLYRKAVFDFKYAKEMVPEPQIQFNLQIIISEIRNVKFVHDALVNASEDVNWAMGQGTPDFSDPSTIANDGEEDPPGIEIPKGTNWLDQAGSIAGTGPQFFDEGSNYLSSKIEDGFQIGKGVGEAVLGGAKSWGAAQATSLGLDPSQINLDSNSLANSIGNGVRNLTGDVQNTLGFLGGSSSPPPKQSETSNPNTQRNDGDENNVFSEAYNQKVAERFFSGSRGQYAVKVLSTFATHRVIFLDNCQFDFEEFPYLETLSAGKFPEQATAKFKIKVGTVTEVNQYGFFEWILNDYAVDSAGPQPGDPNASGKSFSGSLRDFESMKSPYSAWTNPEQRGVDQKKQIARKEAALSNGPQGKGTNVGIGDTLDIKGKALGLLRDNLGTGDKSNDILKKISEGEDILNRLKITGNDDLGLLSSIDFTTATGLYSSIMKTKDEIGNAIKGIDGTSASSIISSLTKGPRSGGDSSGLGNAYNSTGFAGARSPSQSEAEGFDDFSVVAGYKPSLKDGQRNVNLTSTNASTNNIKHKENAYEGGRTQSSLKIGSSSNPDLNRNVYGDEGGIDQKLFPSEFKKIADADLIFRTLREDLDGRGIPHRFKNIGLEGSQPSTNIGKIVLEGTKSQELTQKNIELQGLDPKNDISPLTLEGASPIKNIGPITLEGAKAQTNIGTISLEGAGKQDNIGKISLDGAGKQTNIGTISLEGMPSKKDIGKIELTGAPPLTNMGPITLEGAGKQDSISKIELTGTDPQKFSSSNIGLEGAGKQDGGMSNIGLTGQMTANAVNLGSTTDATKGSGNLGTLQPSNNLDSAQSFQTSMASNVGLQGAGHEGTISGNIGLQGIVSSSKMPKNIELKGGGGGGSITPSNANLSGQIPLNKIAPKNVGQSTGKTQSTISPRSLTFAIGTIGKINPKNVNLSGLIPISQISPKNVYQSR